MGCSSSRDHLPVLPPVDLTGRDVGDRIFLPPEYCENYGLMHGTVEELPFNVRSRRTDKINGVKKGTFGSRIIGSDDDNERNNDKKYIGSLCEHCCRLSVSMQQMAAEIALVGHV